MSKTTRPLAAADVIAAVVVADLAPFCERIAVAGSVRRRTPDVGDLEIVAIPRREQSGGLFGDLPVNTLWEHLHAMAGVYRWLKGDSPDGRYYQLQLPAWNMQLDLFLAGADNWGWIFLVRTGSAAFSHGMLAHYKQLQGMGKDAGGSVNGRLVTRGGVAIPTPEEADVFAMCRLPYTAPEKRTGWEALP